jgi:peptidoglycan/LPS O-acetylase OafA/YrhL
VPQTTVLVTGCCVGNPNDDGKDHQVADGVFIVGLLLIVAIGWLAWRLFGRWAERRAPKDP